MIHRDAPILSVAESSQLIDSLAHVSQAEMPLAPALRALAEELGRGRLSRAFREMAKRLESGAALSVAISQIRMPAHVQAVIALGIQSGDLPGALEQLIEQQRTASGLRRRLRLIVAYPLLLMAVLIAWLTFCSAYLFPQFQSLAEDFDTSVPPSVQLQYELGAALVNYGLATLVGAAVVLLSLRLLGGRWIIDWLRGGVPLFGRLWMYANTAELCQLLALLLHRGAPLPSALDWSACAIRDQVLASSTRRLADSVRAGGDLRTGLAVDSVFPETLAPIAGWGQRTSSLDQAFQAAAEVFQDRVELQIGLIRFVVPPLVFIGVAALILMVVTSTLAPMIHLVQWLSF